MVPKRLPSESFIKSNGSCDKSLRLLALLWAESAWRIRSFAALSEAVIVVMRTSPEDTEYVSIFTEFSPAELSVAAKVVDIVQSSQAHSAASIYVACEGGVT
jgi:hypothetical protein